ncbi:hypothetical protein Taro_010417, partial [Colocasia esculenta]|nr:hypothetical protein [Colocasia esculenta]
VKHHGWKVSPHDLHRAQLHLNICKGWYTTYHEKRIPTKATSTYHHEVPPQSLNTTVPSTRYTTASQTTTGESSLTNHNYWLSASRKERRHHTGIDYWFMMPVSNPDNTTQELPLSLTVTDERSNCSSTTTSQRTVETNQHHTCRPHSCRSMPGTFRDSGPSSLK